jgi:hypothetical protein
MPQIVIRDRWDMSLADLVAIQASGGAVLRSAHIGNWFPANLNVATLGLRCVLINTTTLAADIKYHPSGVIVGRRFCAGLAAPRNTPAAIAAVHRAPVPGLAGFFKPGQSLAVAHVNALRKAVRQADVTLYEDYAERHRELLTGLMELCADEMPELWRRRVKPNGGVQDVATEPSDETPADRRHRLALIPGSWRDMVRAGVFGVTDRRQGWLIPKAVLILSMAVVDSLVYGTPEIYHLGGGSMIHYLDELLPTLQRLYAALRPRVGGQRDLIFNLVPAAAGTLGVPCADREALDRLVDAWLAVRRSGRGSGGGWAGLAGKHELLAGRLRARAALSWAAASCPVPFYDLRDGTYCSQYDLLLSGNDWYAHPWGFQTPLGEVGQMTRAAGRELADVAG